MTKAHDLAELGRYKAAWLELADHAAANVDSPDMGVQTSCVVITGHMAALAEKHQLTPADMDHEPQRTHETVELERFRDTYASDWHEIEQIAAKALGYPRYSDDPVNFPGAKGDDRCVGDHTPVTIVAELADSHERHKAALKDIAYDIGEAMLCDVDGRNGELEGLRLANRYVTEATNGIAGSERQREDATDAHDAAGDDGRASHAALHAHIASAVRLLYPDDMTPNAKRVLESALERHAPADTEDDT